MKTDHKLKADHGSAKSGKGSRRAASKSTPGNGKHPPVTYEHALIGIVEASLEGNYISVNEEFCRMTGYGRQELLQHTIRDFTHEDDYAIDITLHEKLVAGEIPFYRIEKRYLRKEGGDIWVELTRSLVRDAEGKPLYTVGVVLDISDRKDVERVLRESVERLRLATEAAQMFMWEWDFQHNMYTLADNFEQVIGFSGGQLPKNHLESVGTLMLPEDVKQIAGAYEQAIASRSDLHALACRLINPGNGQTVWLEVSAKIVYDAEGSPVRMFGVAQNITKSKQAQEEIATLSRLPAENPNPVMRITPDGKILYGNEASAPLRETWLQQTDLAIPDELQKAITGAFMSGVKQELEIEHKGTCFSFTLAPFREAGYVNLYAKDVTERKRAEDALRTSEERYRGIINQSIGGIAETDLTGKFIMVNEQFSEITGYAREQLLNEMRMQDITHPEDLPRNMELFGHLKTAGTSFEIEKRYLRPDGSIVWVHNSVSAITGVDGKPQSAVAVVIDVTERKRAEETMRRNEELFSTLVEAAPFGVYFIDSGFRLRAINKGSEAVFSGIDPLIGRDFAEILRIIWQEPFATEAIERFRHTLRTGESFISPPIIESRGNIAEIQSYDWQIHRITMPDGTYGVVCYFYDLSEQKRMEATVRASEALYRAIAGSIPAGGVYVVDRDFRYLVAEGPVTEAFGLSREMLEGHTVAEVFPDDRGERMEERLRRTFAGETLSFETKHNGRVYWTRQAPLLEAIGQAIILTLDITERKQAEEALRQSEERFALFMQHLPALAWIKDTQGRYVYANAAAEKAFSTPRDRLYGKTDFDIFSVEVADQFKRNDERALADGKGVQVIETLRQDDGIVHYSLVNKFPIPGLDGNPTLIGGTAVDITERLRAEEALRESEERFRAILRQATAGIVRKDAEGRLIFVNQAFCNMLGYTEAELLGKTIWDFMYEEDIAENKRSYNRLMVEGVPFKLERRLIREDGSVIWVDASVSPIMDADGKSQSSVAVEVDITGRKQAEEALQQLNLQLEERVLSRTAKLRAVNQTLREEITERRRVEEALRKSEAIAQENEAKLRSLFDLLPVGISFLDLQGRVVQMNSALLNILKLTKEEFLSQAYKTRRYIRADGTPMSPTEFASARAIAENRTIYNVEIGIVLGNDDITWTSVSAAPVDVADVSVVIVTVDITEKKRAEQALHDSHARLRILSQRLVEVQEEERRALARELHDRVGQTLAALNINLIIINSQLSGEAAGQIGTRLNDSMKLVAETIALVRDVMTDLRPAVLDDYGLEAALEAHLSKFIARYDIHASFEKPEQPLPRLGPSLEMTLLRIAQEALMNIARHARATQVNLSVQQAEDAICMTIQDNGIGIQSWQEANRPGSHGMTIMRERAEAFGGSLQVRSLPGQGTKIEAIIPLKGRRDSGQENRV